MNKVKGLHPLAESVAKKLFGIESVPVQEQKAMVYRAVMHIEEYIKSKDHAVENETIDSCAFKIYQMISLRISVVERDILRKAIKKIKELKSNDIVRVK